MADRAVKVLLVFDRIYVILFMYDSLGGQNSSLSEEYVAREKRPCVRKLPMTWS